MTSPSLAIQIVDKNFRIDAAAQNNSESVCQSATCNWRGRTVSTIKNGFESFFSKTVFVTQKTISTLGSIAADPNAIAGIFRRLNGQVFKAIEQLASIPGCCSKLRAVSGSAVGYIDALQVATDVDYFCKGNLKKDDNLKAASRVSLFIANAGWTLMWLEEMSFFSLSKAAAALGEVKLFSLVPKAVACIPLVRNVSGLQRLASAVGEIRVFGIFNKLSMNFIAGRALTLFYTFSAVDAIRTLAKADGSKHAKTQAGLDLSNYVSELALDAMLTVGVTNVIGLGAIGAVCMATAVSSFAYKTYK